MFIFLFFTDSFDNVGIVFLTMLGKRPDMDGPAEAKPFCLLRRPGSFSNPSPF
jgi:hypothetical protein